MFGCGRLFRYAPRALLVRKDCAPNPTIADISNKADTGSGTGAMSGGGDDASEKGVGDASAKALGRAGRPDPEGLPPNISNVVLGKDGVPPPCELGDDPVRPLPLDDPLGRKSANTVDGPQSNPLHPISIGPSDPPDQSAGFGRRVTPGKSGTVKSRSRDGKSHAKSSPRNETGSRRTCCGRGPRPSIRKIGSSGTPRSGGVRGIW